MKYLLLFSIFCFHANSKNLPTKNQDRRPSQSRVTCEDSDGGIEPKKKGTVTVTVRDIGKLNAVFSENEKDICQDGRILIESYCEANEPKRIDVDCGNSHQRCANGRCF